jgi:proteasome lid subunit RPN8/RPN11
MKQKSGNAKEIEVRIRCEAVRRIRQHARSSSKAEICGVLIGSEEDGATTIDASIPGTNAVEAGTHVTFTQDTWEHIYRVKDRDYPDARIVGWYHSHPGFGVFLSDHDTFIHKNFFSAPRQVAWVYDPHSDEEGCFGWVEGRLERLARIVMADEKAGEGAGETGKPEPLLAEAVEIAPERPAAAPRPRRDALSTAATMLVYTIVFAAGILLSSYYFFTHYLLVPVDPHTGQPLLMEQPENAGQPGATSAAPDAAQPQVPSASTQSPAGKKGTP